MKGKLMMGWSLWGRLFRVGGTPAGLQNSIQGLLVPLQNNSGDGWRQGRQRHLSQQHMPPCPLCVLIHNPRQGCWWKGNWKTELRKAIWLQVGPQNWGTRMPASNGESLCQAEISRQKPTEWAWAKMTGNKRRLRLYKSTDSQDRLICSNKELSTLWWDLFQEPDREHSIWEGNNDFSWEGPRTMKGWLVRDKQITAAVSAAIAATSWGYFSIAGNLLGPPQEAWLPAHPLPSVGGHLP